MVLVLSSCGSARCHMTEGYLLLASLFRQVPKVCDIDNSKVVVIYAVPTLQLLVCCV